MHSARSIHTHALFVFSVYQRGSFTFVQGKVLKTLFRVWLVVTAAAKINQFIRPPSEFTGPTSENNN